MLLNQGDQVRHSTDISDARMSTQAWRERREGTLKGNVGAFQTNLVVTCFLMRTTILKLFVFATDRLTLCL